MLKLKLCLDYLRWRMSFVWNFRVSGALQTTEPTLAKLHFPNARHSSRPSWAWPRVLQRSSTSAPTGPINYKLIVWNEALKFKSGWRYLKASVLGFPSCQVMLLFFGFVVEVLAFFLQTLDLSLELTDCPFFLVNLQKNSFEIFNQFWQFYFIRRNILSFLTSARTNGAGM